MITVKEAKEIMFNESSVSHAGIEYRKISALIFRKSNGSFRAFAELLDKNRNSVIIVGLDRLRPGDIAAEVNPIDEDIRERITEVEESFGLFIENTLKGDYKLGQEHLHDVLKILIKIDDRIVRFNNNWTDTSTLGGVNEQSTAKEIEHQGEHEYPDFLREGGQA